MRYFALIILMLLLAGCAQKIQVIGGENAVTTGNVTVTPDIPACSDGSSCQSLNNAMENPQKNRVIAIARNYTHGKLLSVSKGKCSDCWVVSFSNIHGFNRTDTVVFIENQTVVNIFNKEYALAEMSAKNCTSAGGKLRKDCLDNEEAIGRVLNSFCCEGLPLQS